MRQLRFAGSPRAIGRAYGETCRDGIQKLYAARIENAIAQAKDYGGRVVGEAQLLAIGKRSLPFVVAHAPDGLAELEGIAEGAGLSTLQVWVMNALTDLRDVAAYAPLDVLEGCSSFIVSGERTADHRAYAGQSWDLSTDNQPHVVLIERHPDGRPATLSLTTEGCLSLIGFNEEGVAIGTTNLRTLDARPGLAYLDVIHRALGEPNLARAVASIRGAHRAGAHYYYLLDGQGRGAGIECSAKESRQVDLGSGSYVHCNHLLDDGLSACEAKGTPVASTHFRQSRLQQLIDQAERPLTVADLQRFLADHEGGQNSICRHDYAGISSNGSLIMRPSDRKAFAVHGPACQGVWKEVSIGPRP